MQSRFFIMGAAVLLAQCLPVRASAQTLTLEQAVARTLSTSPELRAAAIDVAIADGAREQAGLRPNPELSLLREGMSSANRTDTIQLSQPLELGGKRSARIQLAEQDQALAEADLGVVRATLRAEVSAAFLQALTAQEHVALARQSLQLASKATHAASRRVAAGKISPLEQTRSSVAEAGAQLELSQAEADAAQARRRLAAFWGSSAPLDDALQAPDSEPAALPPLAQLQASLDTSPQLRRARQQITREEAQLNLTKAERHPDLTLTVGSKKDQQSTLTQTVVGISVPLPLFNRNQGNMLSALRRVDKARTEAELARLHTTQALADAYQRVTLADQQIAVMRADILPAAQSAFDAAVTGFELGKFGFIDVLDAQRTLFQSRAQYLSALSTRHRALADLQRYVALPGTRHED
ncbi:TolC family protein [Duganella sp. FT80W]|uniref:TolC family protein n=1 Tax=Duganella guangzhouensis TaxID=2666084 RepID=A0A6I2L6Z3_9BURK|nr:TolC family protein [Duganella guangzhouensis]MRW92059.1 TolC family protein [Duganella guangzhouensis]